MKKKIMAMCLVIAMAATAVIGGTLAYFTDTDEAVNVMTLGGVQIRQNEDQLTPSKEGEAMNERGRYDFVQNKPLMPAVYTEEITDNNLIVDGYANPAIKNVVDKIITVTNTAREGAINQDAYVRTIIAFETGVEYKENTDEPIRDELEIFQTYIAPIGSSLAPLDMDPITVNGVKYILAEKVYADPLAPGATSTHSLKQFFLSPEADNEVMKLFGNEYNILAISQATQTAGFEATGDKTAAEVALDTAFGDVETARNPETGKLLVQEWFEALNPANN